jgi:hypothetical protein
MAAVIVAAKLKRRFGPYFAGVGGDTIHSSSPLAVRLGPGTTTVVWIPARAIFCSHLGSARINASPPGGAEGAHRLRIVRRRGCRHADEFGHAAAIQAHLTGAREKFPQAWNQLAMNVGLDRQKHRSAWCALPVAL